MRSKFYLTCQALCLAILMVFSIDTFAQVSKEIQEIFPKISRIKRGAQVLSDSARAERLRRIRVEDIGKDDITYMLNHMLAAAEELRKHGDVPPWRDVSYVIQVGLSKLRDVAEKSGRLLNVHNEQLIDFLALMKQGRGWPISNFFHVYNTAEYVLKEQRSGLSVGTQRKLADLASSSHFGAYSALKIIVVQERRADIDIDVDLVSIESIMERFWNGSSGRYRPNADYQTDNERYQRESYLIDEGKRIQKNARAREARRKRANGNQIGESDCELHLDLSLRERWY